MNKSPGERFFDAFRATHASTLCDWSRQNLTVRLAYAKAADHFAASALADASPTPAERAGRMGLDLWDWLTERTNLTLDYQFGDEGEEGAWVVHRVSGNVNDREWDEIATGLTPREAVEAARLKLIELARGEGA